LKNKWDLQAKLFHLTHENLYEKNLSSAYIYIFVSNSSANPLKDLVEESSEDKISQEDALYSWDVYSYLDIYMLLIYIYKKTVVVVVVVLVKKIDTKIVVLIRVKYIFSPTF
jgi:hypothetical protein